MRFFPPTSAHKGPFCHVLVLGLLSVFLIPLLPTSLLMAQEPSDLPQEEVRRWPPAEKKACVAYQTTKGMFVFFDVILLGKNCQVEIKLETDAEGKKVRVVIQVPVNGFRSDNDNRDEDVAKILGGEKLQPIRFESSYLTKEEVQKILRAAPPRLNGNLYIKGLPKGVVFTLEVKKKTITAQLETTFSMMGVKVPTVGPGGLIAKPREKLTLLGHFPLSQIKNTKNWLTLP